MLHKLAQIQHCPSSSLQNQLQLFYMTTLPLIESIPVFETEPRSSPEQTDDQGSSFGRALEIDHDFHR